MIMQNLQSAADADITHHCEVSLEFELAPIGVEKGGMANDRLLKNRMLIDPNQLALGDYSRTVQGEEMYLVPAPRQMTGEQSTDTRTAAPGIMAHDANSQRRNASVSG